MRLGKEAPESHAARAPSDPYGAFPPSGLHGAEQSEPSKASSGQRGRDVGKRVGKFVGGVVMVAVDVAGGWGSLVRVRGSPCRVRIILGPRVLRRRVRLTAARTWIMMIV